MASKKIEVIVEGDGEVSAIPCLIHKVLRILEVHDVHVAIPKNSNGCGNITKTDGLEKFIKYALYEENSIGAIVLVDADAVGGCPVAAAKQLAARARALNLPKPVAVVVAVKEYEAWIVASIDTIRNQQIDSEFSFPDVDYEGDPEAIQSPKGWINRHFPSNKSYRETTHQLTMTRLIDVNLACERSRSFKRFVDAVKEILVADQNDASAVTP